jgi:hypothetical protein
MAAEKQTPDDASRRRNPKDDLTDETRRREAQEAAEREWRRLRGRFEDTKKR